MYQVILVNLTPDARAVAPHSRVPLPGVAPERMRRLLQNFSAIDRVENSNADTEFRVVVRSENFLVRSQHGKLVFYDMRQRDLPGQILTLDEVIEELNGTAGEVRKQVVRETRAKAEDEALERRSAAGPDNRKLVFLLAVAIGLGIANYRFWPRDTGRFPSNFMPPSGADLNNLKRNLSGIYMTGNGPGQHGIVATGPTELKIFEFGAVEAPRVIYATFTPGWSGAKFCLVTDQPGGLVEVKNDGTLIYCGEIYRRIP